VVGLSERDWWRRALLVLWKPTEVFQALRADPRDEQGERQDPVIALVYIAGLAAALGTERSLFEDVGGLDYLVLAFVTGGAYALIGYWLLGWALGFASERLGGGASRRLVRHTLAYAGAPITFALVPALVYPPLLAAFGVWSLLLLVEGLRIVNGWLAVRAALAALIGVVLVGAIWAGLSVLE
jgi:hypothetical protein